jgi:ribosomal protein S12 methylthiotransferase RimO
MSLANPKVGFVSLGCPKALVDSERILTQLKVEGYDIVQSYDAADVVVVNTCGFIDSAVTESLDAIGEALAENGKVIVTGCLGKKPEQIRAAHPGVLSISGPQDYVSVMSAVHAALPPKHDPFIHLVPDTGIKLTPKHYAYLKISEGCNHRCSFCIIPSMRGDLVSRPVDDVLREAEKLAMGGVKELLVISQDTSAYGVDVKYAEREWRGKAYQTRMKALCEGLGELGLWTRLHYVYPYPHVDEIIPLMADGKILPYLDIPFQHASPRVLKLMKRPGAVDKTLERIRVGGMLRRTSPSARPSSSVSPARPRRSSRNCSISSTKRSSTASAHSPIRRSRRDGQRPAGSVARGREAGPPRTLHGAPGGDLHRQARSQGRQRASVPGRRDRWRPGDRALRWPTRRRSMAWCRSRTVASRA